MKNVKLILLAVTVMLFFGTESVMAQDVNPKTVIIKVCEFSAVFKSRMIITEPSGTSKTIELKNINAKTLEEAVSANNASIQAEINNWKKEGYKIDALTHGSMGDLYLTTIILSKDE